MKTAPRSAGFTLIEVALSVGVATFCMVTMLGLLPVGLMSNQASVEQTAANDILSQVTADLRAAPPLSGTSPQFLIPIPANPVSTAPAPTTIFFSSNGEYSTQAGISSQHPVWRYLLTVTFQPNPSVGSGVGADRAATLANLQVTWPATAPSAAMAQGSVEKFVALNRN